MSIQFKNGSEVKKSLMKEKLVKPSVSVLAENHTENNNAVWEYRMGELMKTEGSRRKFVQFVHHTDVTM